MDWFFFDMADSGDSGAGQADTIHDFNDFEDSIYLKGSYTYAGDTSAPGDGQYSVWNNGNSNGGSSPGTPSRRGWHDVW